MPVQIKVMDVTMNGAVLLSTPSGAARWVSKGDVLDISTPSAPAGDGNRWEAFSDEEVQSFYGLLDVSLANQLEQDLFNELGKVLHRRQDNYRGPGIYQDYAGFSFDVIGHAVEEKKIVLRSHDNENLFLESWNSFNDKVNGSPAYRYLRALGD